MMPLTLIGYARCTADQHDIEAQRRALLDLGVQEDRIYLDAGHTAAHRNRASLDQALTALRPGDTLAVHKLGRLARSVADVRAIGQTLADRGARVSIGGAVYDPHHPIGEAFFTALSMVVELQTSIQAVRSRQSVAIAIANGRHVGRPPKLNEDQGAQLANLHGRGKHTAAELAEQFGVSRSTMYRTLQRATSNPNAAHPDK